MLLAAGACAADFDWMRFKGSTVSFLVNNNSIGTAIVANKAEFERLTGITLKVDIYQEQQMRQRLVTVLNARSDETDVFILDAKLRSLVRAEIKTLSQELRTTMIFVTHDQIEAMTMADRLVVLQAEVIQQVGTPEQVYETPANQFVAGFIGSPSMNFFPVAIQDQHAVLADGTRLRLPDRLGAGRLAGHGNAVLGLWPEAMTPVPDGDAGLRVQVSLVEPLGSDTLVHFPLGQDHYVARVPPDTRPRVADRLTLAADPGRMHLFDATTGSVLG